MQQENQKYLSIQAKALFDALCMKGIKAELEYYDGHKTVDIAILEAKLYIEVDGIQHFTNAEQIMRDFKRNHFSDGDDFSTFYVTNQIIDNYLNEVVDAITEVVRKRSESHIPINS